ncbi:MAG: NAD-dependent epimerase/dehydratase family protein [Thermoleophilia bacterium]|nr:NAD-dependent epimerase/dehydratase family protein [Thermoleophilia bacterium]
MRIAIIGATGNCGSALVRALVAEDAVVEVVGIARRAPEWELPKVRWHAADIATDDLVAPLSGVDAVVHLAWLIQPSHDVRLLERVNVHGNQRVLDAVVRAGVPNLVVASSVGAYGPRETEEHVDESWPTTGIASNLYSRQKVAQERQLDAFEANHPDVRVARLRPALVFQAEAGSSIRRIFAGPLLPRWILRRRGMPLVPGLLGLRSQCVHASDVADAYRRVLLDPAARGAYNVATEPDLTTDTLRRVLRARAAVPLPAPAVRVLAEASWRAHLQPTPGSWVDLAMQSPLLSSARIREELGWEPAWSAEAALTDLLRGMGGDIGLPTPVLDPAASGPGRAA